MTELLVNEIYDKLTFQGEGPSVGKLCTFIRLSNCNLACGYCDSSFTWAFTKDKIKNHLYVDTPFDVKDEVHKMTIDEIINKVVPLNPPMIIITGGEPMIQSEKLFHLISNLGRAIPNLKRIEIETAGTLWNQNLAEKYCYDAGWFGNFVYFNVSPKLENSGNPKELRYKRDVLLNFNELAKAGKAVFKFVIMDKSDLVEVKEIASDIGIRSEHIYIMPEGIDKETQNNRLKDFAEVIIDYGYNLTPRLHVQIWNDKRGV